MFVKAVGVALAGITMIAGASAQELPSRQLKVVGLNSATPVSIYDEVPMWNETIPAASGGQITARYTVRDTIAPALRGHDAADQQAVDAALIALDPTPLKDTLGGNATVAVSLAVLHAAAADAGKPLWRHVADMAEMTRHQRREGEPQRRQPHHDLGARIARRLGQPWSPVVM